MNELPKCPDCGAPMNVEHDRDIGREVRKEEIAMSYFEAHRAGDETAMEEYRKLPAVVGRMPNTPWVKTETCTQCQYQAVDGHWTRRGRATADEK